MAHVVKLLQPLFYRWKIVKMQLCFMSFIDAKTVHDFKGERYTLGV